MGRMVRGHRVGDCRTISLWLRWHGASGGVVLCKAVEVEEKQAVVRHSLAIVVVADQQQEAGGREAARRHRVPASPR